MPHLVEAFRGVRLRHFLRGKDTRLKAWALVDDQGFLREVSPAFGSCLRANWPGWNGNLLPAPLAKSVIEGRAYKTKSIVIELRQSENLRFLEVKARSALDKLTAREGEIVGRYANGDTYSAISVAFSLSPATVRNHLSHCYKKLGIHNKAELVNLLASKARPEQAPRYE
jgi:DNA-binding CsgD family transcriptional regulator